LTNIFSDGLKSPTRFLGFGLWGLWQIQDQQTHSDTPFLNVPRFASQLVLGQDDGNWQEATKSPTLHRAGLLGSGQILGLGVS